MKAIIVLILPFFINSTHSHNFRLKPNPFKIETFSTPTVSTLPFGDIFIRKKDEDATKFVSRILNEKGSIHHGAFELTEFRNCIVSFAEFNIDSTPTLIGILLEPVSPSRYRLLKTLELNAGCGENPSIESVFLHDIDQESLGRELIIHAVDNCGRHGNTNFVFGYNGVVENNNLVLQTSLRERCGYSEVKIDGEWDFDMGDTNVEDRRFIECKFSDYKSIRAYFDSIK